MQNSDFSTTIREFASSCKLHLISAAIFSGFINALYIAPSIFMLQVYDRVVPTRGGNTLFLLTVILALSLVVFSALDAVRLQLLLRASLRLERLAAPEILNRVLGAGRATTVQRSQAIRDFDTIRAALTGPAVVAIFDAPWAPIYILISYLLHPLIGLLALLSCFLLIGVAVAGNFATKGGQAMAMQKNAIAYRYQEFSVQSSEVIRTLGMRRAIVNKHIMERRDIVGAQSQVAGIAANYLAITKFLRLLLQSMALAVGAWLAINQHISAGAIFASSFILGRALQPVEQILNSFKNVLDARMAYRNLDAFCRQPLLLAKHTSLPTPKGRIEADSINVLAPNTDKRILSNVSFTIEPGEVVALLGPSGAGKSTLLRVMAGALEPDEGEMRVDGARYADWDREQLARNIGYMPQSPTLFPASVFDNISRFKAYESGSGSADLNARVIAAAQSAHAHNIILRFANGYDTSLHMGEGGGLSAGQSQMVALSRALFDSPPILFLDEPNAHLDMNGEQGMLSMVGEFKKRGATVVISTHRTGLLQIVDKIMLLHNGELKAFGNRSELVQRQTAVPPPRKRGTDQPKEGQAASDSKPSRNSEAPPPYAGKQARTEDDNPADGTDAHAFTGRQ
jgi:PrtD family type I secretion system ABC transporter